MIKMAKFKNKKTGVVIEENLLYYINKLKNNVNFKEMKEEEKTSSPDKLINKKEVAK
jgi:hypothetical protein